jgi:hypothetical protein
MNNVYERISIVCADLARIEITNEDPMRFSKRCCKRLAHDALEKAVYQAEEWILMISRIESDAKQIKEQP